MQVPQSPQLAFLSGIGTVSRDESILPGFGSPYRRLHQLAGREPPRDVPPHRRIIPGRGRDELLQPLMVHPSRAAIGSIDLRRPSASSPRTYSSPAARWSLRACWARIHDRGGNLRLLIAAWACHAAVWYSCVSPPKTCFRRVPVFGGVDRLRRPGASLTRCELAEGTVRPGGVVVQQVLGQHLSQVMLIDDQQPTEKLPAQGSFRSWRSLLAPAAG